MHLVRVVAMLACAILTPRDIIVGLALALSYVEIYPMRALRFLGGDRALDAANETRSPD